MVCFLEKKVKRATDFAKNKISSEDGFCEENFEWRRGKASEGSDGVETYVERLESML